VGLWRRCSALVRNLVFRSRVERDLRDELESYVELFADERAASGVPREDAARRARLALGGAATVAEAVRARRAGVAIEEAWQDARRSVRALRRAPGFAALAILTIALGVGANTAMFSVVDAAILKPLPYAHPDQLVEIATVAHLSANQRALQIGMSWASLDRWRAEKELVSAIVTYQGPSRVTVEGVAISGPTQMTRISPALPAELGIAPIIGRTFDADDARADAAVLLAEPFWRTAFHASPSALGTTLTLDRRPYRIVGVMPATLSWGVGNSRVIAWLPLDDVRARADHARFPFIGAIARLRPGLSLEQASRDLPRIVDGLQPRVAKDRRWDVQLVPLDTRGMSAGTTRQGLAVLFGAVGLVLLTACANVANLLLARALTREREIGIAAALGATRARLVRQFMIEGAVLALAGGVVALLLLWWTAGVLPVIIPEQLALFAANPLTFDVRTAVYGALLVLIAAVAASAFPALRASRPNLPHIIGSGVRVAGRTPNGRRWRVALQVAQVAVACVLLTGAALLTASVVRMVATPAGYDIDRLATINLALPEPRYTSAAVSIAFFNEFLSRVRALPGVTAAYGPPPSGSFTGRFVAFGQEDGPLANAQTYAVDPDYFRVAGIRLKEGRALGVDDTATSPPVAVIDERAAELMWPGQSAIGQRFRYSPYTPLWVTVVGIAHSVKTMSFAETGGSMQAYVPAAQEEPSRYRLLLVRSVGDPAAALEPIRRLAVSMEPNVEFLQMAPVADLYRDVYVEPRFFSRLMTVLALLALVPAAVGLYAIVTHAVNERTHEIGVRIALGADVRRVRRLVCREALAPVAAGILVGAAAVVYLARFLSSLLYQTAPLDPLVLAVVAGVLLVVAAIAAALPAHLATQVDPVETLRAG
jgi:putative ABC transport system permease protein